MSATPLTRPRRTTTLTSSTLLLSFGLVVMLASDPARACAQSNARRLEPLVLGPDVPAWVRHTLDGGAANAGSQPGARLGAQFSESRLGRLREADALRERAVQATTRARDDEALQLLTRARGVLASLADVPGAVAHLVEVHLLTARVAHAAGLFTLFEQSIERAALLEPERRLRVGEASPDVLEAAARVHERTRGRAPGRFVVFVRDMDGVVAGARVFLDDREVPVSAEGGERRFRVEAPAGPHLIRIDAPGHRTRGFAIDVLPGERHAQVFRIGLHPDERVARMARRAARQGERQPLLDVLGDYSAWVIEPSRDGQRALVRLCAAAGCGPAVRWTPDATPAPPAEIPAESPGDLPDDGVWLMGADVHTSPRSREARRRRRENRWPVWLAASLSVVGGGLAAAIIASRPGPPPALRTTVDFGDLTP